jgi:hypothetical protein
MDISADPPDAFLVTNDEWPVSRDFRAIDKWLELNQLLSSSYQLAESGKDDYIQWRLYLHVTFPHDR